MADPLLELADEIVAALADEDFTLSLAASREYDLVLTLEEAAAIRVEVFPLGETSDVDVLDAGGSTQKGFDVRLIVRKKLINRLAHTAAAARETARKAECDGLMNLSADIEAFLVGSQLASALCTEASRPQAYSPELLADDEQFACEIQTHWLRIDLD